MEQELKISVHEHINKMESEDLVVIERGENAVQYLEERKPISAISSKI